MTDNTELKRLAEAFPEYDYDSNTEPFFNGPSGESLGGGSTGFYCVYGPEFEIDGESHEGVTLVESCPADQAKFICEAKAGILALIAENYRLKTFRSTTERDLAQELEVWKHGPSCWGCGDTGDVHDMVGEWRGHCDCNAAKLIDVSSERDQFKAENEALRKDSESYRLLSFCHGQGALELVRSHHELCAEIRRLKILAGEPVPPTPEEFVGPSPEGPTARIRRKLATMGKGEQS